MQGLADLSEGIEVSRKLPSVGKKLNFFFNEKLFLLLDKSNPQIYLAVSIIVNASFILLLNIAFY